MGTKNDYDVAYIPLEEIIDSNILTNEQKLAMIESIVKKVLHGASKTPGSAEPPSL